MLVTPQSFRLLAELGSAAPRGAVVFDLDGTIASNTISDFFQFALTQSTFVGDAARQFLGRGYQAWLGGSHEPLKELQARRSESPYRELLSEYAARSRADQIYPRTAEELAQARACLQCVVLITGSFDVFATPLLEAIGADHVFMNRDLARREIRGENKPDLLASLFSEAGLAAHAVYTDEFPDRHMLVDPRLAWRKVHLVLRRDDTLSPGWEKMIPGSDWIQLRRTSSGPYCWAVKDYASHVIRQADRSDNALGFYQRWQGLVKEQWERSQSWPDDPNRLETTDWELARNAAAVAGLYLKEPDAVKAELTERLSPRFDLVCFELYQRLVQWDPTHPAPLELFPAETES